ncbi:MAG TPA: M1 family metallopeptidase [Chryseolinea sp.]|nr:M1 family metallopeptidase [Chryseolinea sp.]
MRYRFLALFLIAPFLGAGQDLKSGGILKPEQAIMDVRHYTIKLAVDPVLQSIDGTTEIEVALSQFTQTLVFDLVSLLEVRKVWVNNKPAAFTHENDLIRISPASPLTDAKATVKIEYGGKPGVSKNPPWVGGFTWAQDSLGHPWVAITCQSEGAKIYFPCKDHPSDEPNEGADLIITVPDDLYVAGPGSLKSNVKKGHKRTFHWTTSYPINNYSILFNIGRYKVVTRSFTSVSGDKIPLQFYVLNVHENKANRLLDALERCMKLEEKYFGPYPWPKDKIAICETPHLGMEHQTLNAYGNKFRYTVSGGKDFDWLLLHELGHEWWGNKITVKDWSDMWIHEGICSFADRLYTLDYAGKEAYLQQMKETARGTSNLKPIIPGSDVDADAVYQYDIYVKGAFFMHTLRYIIGDEIFFPTLKKLATDARFTYDNFITTDDVEGVFSQASGMNLKPVFHLYLRTTNKLDIGVKQTGNTDYLIKLLNFTDPLPLDIQTSNGTERIMVGKKGVTVRSDITPIVDPDVYYLKRVILE